MSVTIRHKLETPMFKCYTYREREPLPKCYQRIINSIKINPELNILNSQVKGYQYKQKGANKFGYVEKQLKSNES